jgi:methionyl-tRNA synthetase
MEKSGNPYFISTTIPYVNAKPHLGHAFEFVQADAFARYHREIGDDVFFLTGSDENSLKNVLAAEAEGLTTRELVDRNVNYFLELRDALALSYDGFIRTSVDEEHIEGARRIWEALDRSGDIYRKSYGGLYCVGCEQFYSPEELVDGLCPEHHTPPPEYIEEENYFFRLSRYQEQLDRIISSGELEIIPDSRRNEVLSFIRSGLRDFSISRSQERARGWGIAVPGDPTQVMYVWVDALTNYINALGYATDSERYRRYWVDNPQRVHVLGKGVIRFHAIYWPAMLLSAGVPLPTTDFVHGYITLGGAKLSKSAGNSFDVLDLTSRYGGDAVRYFLLRDVPPTADADFSEERLVERYNSDLANGLGNLVSRILTMIDRYREGTIPPSPAGDAAAEAVRRSAIETRSAVDVAMRGYDHRAALVAVWELVRSANAFVADAAPWELAKAGEEEKLDVVLGSGAEALRQIGLALRSLLPDTASAILDRVAAADLPDSTWDPAVLAGRRVVRGEPLFPRIVLTGG